MKGKVLFVVGLGVGYVLGTRAGRHRYEQIKSAWLQVWESPVVQRQVHTVQDYAADRIGDLGSMVTENIKRAVSKPGGAPRRATETGESAAEDFATPAEGSGSAAASPGSGARSGARGRSGAGKSAAGKSGADKGTARRSSAAKRPGSTGPGGQAS